MKTFAFFILALGMLVVLTSSNPTCTVNYSSATGYTFDLGTGANVWRSTSSEDYTFCWVFSKGDYQSTVGYNGPQDAGAPNTILPNAACPTGEVLVTTTATNRYGDDNDKKRVAGGTCGTSLPALSFLSFPPNQNYLPSSQMTRIVTDHGNTLAAKNNQLLLILTVNNDSFVNASGQNTVMLTGNNYALRLYHKNGSVTYGFTQGVAETAYPGNENEYFAFADLTQGTVPTYSGWSAIKSWNITNNFQGHEKNVYCLLTIPDLTLTEGQPITDSFLVVLANQGGVIQGSESKTVLSIGRAYDPNVISVDKETSAICGASEEVLEYVIHFQNTGSMPADSVFVNLETDPALDPNTINVLEAGIGTSFTYNAASTSPANTSVRTTNCSALLANNSNAPFTYTVNANPQNPPCVQTGTVKANCSFLFRHINLASNSTAPGESTGFIRFTIKTKQPYTTIRNKAGIFFDTNPEIVTNLAVTTCAESSDSIAAQLAACHDELENCKKHQSGGGWMDWLPWIIAGFEFLILIYLLTRKKN